jgi:hypothetical protein
MVRYNTGLTFSNAIPDCIMIDHDEFSHEGRLTVPRPSLITRGGNSLVSVVLQGTGIR